MINQRKRGLNAMIGLGLILIATAFFWAYLVVYRAVQHPPDILVQRYVLYSLLVCLALLFYVVSSDFLDRDWLGQGFAEVQAASFRQVATVATFLLIYLVAAKDKAISRVFLFSFLPLLYLVLLGANHWLPMWLAKRLFQGLRADKTLLIGSPAEIGAVRGWAIRKAAMGFQIVGVLTEEPSGQEIEGFPVLGQVASLPDIIRRYDVTQVIVAALPNDGDLIGEVAAQCDAAGARFMVVANLDERFRRAITIIDDDGYRFIAWRREPLENPVNRTLKRAVDLMIAVPVVVLILPILTALVWAFQRLQSPGPIFYLQDRAGIYNLPFKILKFRTMHPNNSNVAQQASKGDSRVYPAGRYFRRFSIDEFPQFINVLRGDMSVVGPRPHLPEHNAEFAKVMNNYGVRTFVKPGITGLAQVRGFRGETKEDAQLIGRVESDIHYLENWSFSMEIMIILRTAWQVVAPPKTAY